MKVKRETVPVVCDMQGCRNLSSIRISPDDNPAHDIVLCEDCAAALRDSLTAVRRKGVRA